MSVIEIKTIKYKCDACNKSIPESEVFRKFEFTLWSDRDATARMRLLIDLSIPYHNGSVDICRTCALAAFKRASETLSESGLELVESTEAKP